MNVGQKDVLEMQVRFEKIEMSHQIKISIFNTSFFQLTQTHHFSQFFLKSKRNLQKMDRLLNSNKSLGTSPTTNYDSYILRNHYLLFNIRQDFTFQHQVGLRLGVKTLNASSSYNFGIINAAQPGYSIAIFLNLTM